MPEKYDDEMRRMAIARLAVNDGDYEKTGDELGISPRTIRRWVEKEEKPTIPELLEIVLADMLTSGPGDKSARGWAETVAVLIDKWMMINEQPTSRIETLFRTLETLADDDLDRVLFRLEALETSLTSGRIREDAAKGNGADTEKLEEITT